jgi:formylmethanofuran dehydrogenase subunit E-like metal-binding protein
MGKKEDTAQKIIMKEIEHVQNNPFAIKDNGCAACHVLFTLSREMEMSEQDASDLMSQVLTEIPLVNDSFIEMVETIHLKRRMMGTIFAIKTREAKDKYIYSNFKNTLAELHGDMVNYGPGVVLRKLLLSMISLELAKNIGIDHHASTEELYYFMRKNDRETQETLQAFVDNLYERIKPQR